MNSKDNDDNSKGDNVMAKRKKMIVIILGILVLGVAFFIAATIGMDEVRDFNIPAIDMSQIADGEYEGACDISRWALRVRVTVHDHLISDVSIVDRMKSNMSDNLITAIHQQILGRKSPNFDTVTGASITSKAYLIAIADALYAGMQTDEN